MHRILRFSSGLFVATLLAGALLLILHVPTWAQGDTPATLPGQTSLRINELMADNKLTLVDPDEPDETPDWIEIYNPTDNPVSLTGLALTDDRAVPDKHVITDGVTIPANGFLVFFADNDPQAGPASPGLRVE